VLGPPNPTAIAQLAQALGPGAQVVGIGPPSVDLAADWDCCWLAGRRIDSLDDWRAALQEGRLGEVQGAFALAWLAPDGGLTLARDAIGERTLYYAPLPGGVVFASTLRAVLASGLVPRVLHLPAIAAYLSYAYVPGKATLIAGVHELLPGEVIAFREGETRHTRMWSLPGEADVAASEEELRHTLRACLEQAVRRRLPAAEPVGATLSGGIDSSLVVALASRCHDGPVHTFSVSFGPGYANELPFSSLVAEHCRTNHCVVELSPAAVLHYLDDSIALLSDPIGDPLTVPNALLFREAAATVGVVLNGEGGDPCFGGPKNLPMLLAELYGDGGPGARERCYLRSHLKCYDDLPRLLRADVLAALAEAPLERDLAPWFQDGRWKGLVTRLQAINVALKGAHHILPKVDAVSRPFGVTPRSPLFDRAVVETAFAIPPQLKLRGAVEKYLLKEAVRDLLPAVVVERPKSGMLVPVEAWFQGPLQAQARERLLDGLTPFGLLQRPYLERLLAGQLGGLRPRHGAKIWLLVTLEAWLRTVFRSS
jgi:asparagine synthase (glutamine-hydrolysing)